MRTGNESSGAVRPLWLLSIGIILIFAVFFLASRGGFGRFPGWGEPERAWICRSVRRVLETRSPIQEVLSDAPGVLLRRRQTTLVVRLHHGGGASTARTGTGNSVLEALADALGRRLAADPGAGLSRVQVDLVGSSYKRLAGKSADLPLWQVLPAGNVGLEASWPGWSLRILPGDFAQRGWAAQNRPLRELLPAIARDLGGEPPPEPAKRLRLRTFKTTSFVERSDRNGTLPLVRGRPWVSQVGDDDLIQGAASAGRWLIRAQLPSGRYHYQYDPIEDTYDDSKYNMPRHSGVTFSLFELYDFTRDARFLQAGRRGLDYAGLFLAPGAGPGTLHIQDARGRGTLGSTALTLAARSEYLRLAPRTDRSDLEKARAMARWILGMQKEDGLFKVIAGPDTDPSLPDEESYYPGEALYALMLLYRADPQPEWLQAARRGIQARMARQKKRLPLYDTWFVRALRQIQSLEPSEEYLRHSAALSRNMMRTIYPPGGPRYPPVSLGALCSRMEGIFSAVLMFQEAGRTPPSDLTRFLEDSVLTVKASQFAGEDSFYLPNPAGAEGGFMGTAYSHTARMDVAQHCLSAYLGIVRVRAAQSQR